MTFHGSCTSESLMNSFSISLCAIVSLSYVYPDGSTPVFWCNSLSVQMR
jgi:hypothetical protein